MMTDRTVHASGEAGEIVRYERAGKWYFELPDDLNDPEPRTLLTCAQAAEWALVLWYAGGDIHLDLPGGRAFDHKVAGILKGLVDA